MNTHLSFTLAGVAQLVRVSSSYAPKGGMCVIPGQGIDPGCWFDPQWGLLQETTD